MVLCVEHHIPLEACFVLVDPVFPVEQGTRHAGLKRLWKGGTRRVEGEHVQVSGDIKVRAIDAIPHPVGAACGEYHSKSTVVRGLEVDGSFLRLRQDQRGTNVLKLYPPMNGVPRARARRARSGYTPLAVASATVALRSSHARSENCVCIGPINATHRGQPRTTANMTSQLKQRPALGPVRSPACLPISNVKQGHVEEGSTIDLDRIDKQRHTTTAQPLLTLHR